MPNSLADGLSRFQFTHPGKGATQEFLRLVKDTVVSIHAPWEGCDLAGGSVSSIHWCFNSRTLGRVRLLTHSYRTGTDSFNSRTLGRVRHRHAVDLLRDDLVSIHAPWEGCDDLKAHGWDVRSKFQFTHPGKGATAPAGLYRRQRHVSIHAPWEGCDPLSTS